MTLNAESCILSVIFAEYCLRRLPQISFLYWMSLCWMSWRLKSNICTWLAHLWTLNSKGCLNAMLTNKRPGNTNWRGRRLSTVDLLVPTSLDQLLWNWKHYLLSYKTRYPNEEFNCTEPSPSVGIPWCDYHSSDKHSSIVTRRVY